MMSLFCFSCQCFAREHFNTAFVQRPAVWVYFATMLMNRRTPVKHSFLWHWQWRKHQNTWMSADTSSTRPEKGNPRSKFEQVAF